MMLQLKHRRDTLQNKGCRSVNNWTASNCSDPQVSAVWCATVHARPSLDAASHPTYTADSQAGDYGKQRVWASIGWGAASLPAGWLISQTGIASGFAVYGLASIPLLYVASQLRYNYSNAAAAPVQQAPLDAAAGAASHAAGAADKQQQQQQGVGMRQLLQQPAVVSFLWQCLLMGFGLGVMGTYECLWLKQLGAPETLLGMALLVSLLAVQFVAKPPFILKYNLFLCGRTGKISVPLAAKWKLLCVYLDDRGTRDALGHLGGVCTAGGTAGQMP
jgi:hypothetical protein